MSITEKTMQEYLREYLRIKEEADRLEARKKDIAGKIREELGDTAKESFGKYTVTTFVTIRPTVSAKAIKEDLPEVFAKYGKETEVPNIRVSVAK